MEARSPCCPGHVTTGITEATRHPSWGHPSPGPGGGRWCRQALPRGSLPRGSRELAQAYKSPGGGEHEAEQTWHVMPGTILSRKGRGCPDHTGHTVLAGPLLMSGVGPLVPCVQDGGTGTGSRGTMSLVATAPATRDSPLPSATRASRAPWATPDTRSVDRVSAGTPPLTVPSTAITRLTRDGHLVPIC